MDKKPYPERPEAPFQTDGDIMRTIFACILAVIGLRSLARRVLSKR